MIPVFIPTYKRVGKQITIHQFPRSLWGKWVWLVAPADEDHGDLPVIVAPDSVCGAIRTKRQWISEYAQERYEFHIQADDDMKIVCRDKSPFDAKAMLRKFHSLMKENPGLGTCHAAPRAFSMGRPSVVFNTSSVSVLRCFRTEALQNCQARFDDFKVLEDQHVMMSIMESGYSIATLFDWLVSIQSGPKFSGGTQTEKIFQDMVRYDAEAKRMIANHHPDLVTWSDLPPHEERKTNRSVPSNIAIKVTTASFYKKWPPTRG